MPEVNHFVLQIMATVAEQAGHTISLRTQVVAKARGIKLQWAIPVQASGQH